MRVLNVNMSLDLVHGGGTAERTYQISRTLVVAGAECDLLILNLGLTAKQLKVLERVRVFALPCINKRFYVPWVSPRQLREIVEGVDVVHLMGHWTMVNAVVYLFARYLNKPYVVCPAGALPIYGRSRLLKRIYNRLIGKRIVKDADGHVAIVEAEAPLFEAYGVSAKRVVVIPNGISEADFPESDGTDFRTGYRLGDHPFALFVGRLSHIKGPDLLLRAFSEARGELRDHHLVFVGPDDGMLPELEDAAARLGVEDRVHFAGFLGGTDKADAYRAADLLVIPSRQEAMSIVVLEAGITSTPVLLTDRCGFAEVEEVGGGKVVPASVEGLRGGLVELFRDPDALEAMGANLKEMVGTRFSWDSATEKYLALYDQVLGDAGQRGCRALGSRVEKEGDPSGGR